MISTSGNPPDLEHILSLEEARGIDIRARNLEEAARTLHAKSEKSRYSLVAFNFRVAAGRYFEKEGHHSQAGYSFSMAAADAGFFGNVRALAYYKIRAAKNFLIVGEYLEAAYCLAYAAEAAETMKKIKTCKGLAGASAGIVRSHDVKVSDPKVRRIIMEYACR